MPLAQRILSTTTLGLLLCTLAVFGVQPVQAAASCSITTNPANATIDEGQSVDFTGAISGKGKKTCEWTFDGGVPAGATTDCTVSVTYASAGSYTATLDGTASRENPSTCQDQVTVTVNSAQDPQCDDGIDNDGDTLIDLADPGCVDANDNDETDAPSVAVCSDGIDNDGDGLTDFPADPGCYNANHNNEVNYDPIDPDFAPQTDFKIMMNYELGMHCTGFEFAYCCVLPAYNSILAQVVKPNQSAPQHGGDYPMLMEGDPREGLDALGRETVVRHKGELSDGKDGFIEGDFKKYVLKYWHEAQPRNDGRGKPQSSLLISAVEGNSLMSWNTTFDSAALNADGTFVTGEYNGSQKVVKGNGILGEPADNYQNAVWNHLYFYNGLEGHFACSAPANNVGKRCSEDADCDEASGDGVCNVTSDDSEKVRLGVNGQVVYPTDCGPALHPMGPTTQNGDPNGPEVANDCGGYSNGNVLTFSGHKGTVVYTQMKVLENLPIMLTSPDIWEALGLPLTPFEDSVDFFSDPGLLNEDSVRPFVAMKAQMYDYDPNASDGAGAATLDSVGDPVIGFGTAPIDIPNCERCHSNPADGNTIQNAENEGGGVLTVINSPNSDPEQYAMVQAEYNYWNAYYTIDKVAGDSDWYSRLKSAAVSMLNGHDIQHGTSFAANYPGCGPDSVGEVPCGDTPQNTRLGHESVICQRCHADNVIAAVKSAECGSGNTEQIYDLNGDPVNEACAQGTLIKPITEAIHNNHRGVNMADANGVGGKIIFADSNGRDGGCQGCHPAHRSDGDMNGYPITLAGGNRYAGGDNRGANGGCFVGRDVHSNPGKDTDGAETPAHMNAVGQYLVDNVASTGNGIWCTNCHNQLGQEIWKAENMVSLVHGVPGKEADLVTDAVNIRALPTLADIADAVGTTTAQAESWLDPTQGLNPGDDDSYAIWATLPEPGLCAFLVDPGNPANDGNVATIEVAIPALGHECSTPDKLGPVDCSSVGGPIYNICGTNDADGDFSVNALDFCTTPDCVAIAQGTLTNSAAVPVPMSAATDGRDHWLSPGEPHCADCHAAPFVEQSGNINAYPPFNYPRKASLMRYSRGHQDISCQGCHESIHGLYPVTPNIDTTSYAQAAALNHDGSHGPLKCGTCHEVDRNGIPTWMSGVKYNGNRIRSYDDAVAWAHTFTDEVSPLEVGGVCENCHGDRSSKMGEDKGKWLRHSFVGRIGRDMQDKAEIAVFGHVAGGEFVDADDLAGLANTVCTACHSLQGGPDGAFVDLATCDNTIWKSHNIDGRLAEKVWEYVTMTVNDDDDPDTHDTCGW